MYLWAMERVIKFRGKIIKYEILKRNGTWAIGHLTQSLSTGEWDITLEYGMRETNVQLQYLVDPETIGQFTHRYQDNDFYEGDVFKNRLDTKVYVLTSHDYCFGLIHKEDGFTPLFKIDLYCFDKLGNITDNPELLEA